MDKPDSKEQREFLNEFLRQALIKRNSTKEKKVLFDSKSKKVKSSLIYKLKKKFLPELIFTPSFRLVSLKDSVTTSSIETDIDKKETFALDSKTTIKKKIYCNNFAVSYIDILFGTHKRKNKGIIKVKVSNGSESIESSVLASELVDNSFYRFKLPSTIISKTYIELTLRISEGEDDRSPVVWGTFEDVQHQMKHREYFDVDIFLSKPCPLLIKKKENLFILPDSMQNAALEAEKVSISDNNVFAKAIGYSNVILYDIAEDENVKNLIKVLQHAKIPVIFSTDGYLFNPAQKFIREIVNCYSKEEREVFFDELRRIRRVALACDGVLKEFSRIQSEIDLPLYSLSDLVKGIPKREEKIEKTIPLRFTKQKSLRILSYRWHCSHQYELYKLGHNITLFTGVGPSITSSWNFDERILPENVSFEDFNEVNPNNYDLAILHFDENVLTPQRCNGEIPLNWGESFKRLLNTSLPKVAICHGTPQFYGQYRTKCESSELGFPILSEIELFRELLKDTLVICNSFQAQKEWNFAKSKVIWHGFSSDEFTDGSHKKSVLFPGDSISQRPIYRGEDIYNGVSQILGDNVELSQLFVEYPSVNYESYSNEYAAKKFSNYVKALGEFSVYFNPTVRSPMPRGRGEAMMCGLVTVNYNSHDVDKFIDNGINGFYADSVEELAEQITFLIRNPSIREKIGRASRDTAIELFNIDRYLSDWREVLKSL